MKYLTMDLFYLIMTNVVLTKEEESLILRMKEYGKEKQLPPMSEAEKRTFIHILDLTVEILRVNATKLEKYLNEIKND